MRVRHVVSSVLLSFSAAAWSQTLEVPLEYEQTKVVPDVTLDRVQDIFGFNLDNAEGIEKIFLLALGMDHTSPGSPNADQEIGIPYIVDMGPSYWVSRLQKGQYELEVIVNNALLLMFTKEEIPGGEKAASALLEKASDMGYWPAYYYVADSNITKYLSRNISELTSSSSPILDPKLKRMAAETMAKFTECADIGFAPCQYRLGFWLTSAESSMKEGLDILMHAIMTTLADKRYQGILNGSVIEAAKEVVMKGDLVGIDNIVRQEYLTLMKDQIHLVQRGEGLTVDAAKSAEQFIEPIMQFMQREANL